MAIMSFKQGLIVDFVPEYGGKRKHKLKTVIGIKPLNNDGSIDFMDELTKQLVDCDDVKERAKVSKEVAKQSFIRDLSFGLGAGTTGDSCCQTSSSILRVLICFSLK